MVWTEEALAPWEESKKILARAVALSVPDWEGAMSGNNPFIYLGDRSLDGVGGGLFQRPGKNQLVPEHVKGQVRPISLWCKSLDKTQHNWTTWEGELYSISEGLYHNRDIVPGCHVVIGTDHLKNIIVNVQSELRQPAKLLRWLMEIASLCIVH